MPFVEAFIWELRVRLVLAHDLILFGPYKSVIWNFTNISLLFQIKKRKRKEKRKKKTGLTLNYHYSTLYRCNYVSNN